MNVSCRDLVPIIETALRSGARVRLTATGGSMFPSIRDGETVELEAVSGHDVVAGDVLLVRRNDGVFVLHRAARVETDRVLMVSDAGKCDGYVPIQSIVARASALFRRGRRHNLNRPSARALGLAWQRLAMHAPGTVGLAIRVRRAMRRRARAGRCRQPA